MIPVFSYDLVVDLANRYRSVTHLASGSLYGLYDDSTPSDSLVIATKPTMFVQPPPGATHEPNVYDHPVGIVLDVDNKALRAGATVAIRMCDIFPTFPYHFVSIADWQSKVTTMISAWKASGAGNLYAWEIYNEPDWTWDGNSIISFNELWKLTYNMIRSQDPGAKIMGPAISWYDATWMSNFLTYCKNNNCYPDIVCWHELQGAWNIQGNINTYKALEAQLGMYRPVSIDEYVASGEDGRPGKITDYISGFERNTEIETACLPFWSYCGTLGNILTSSNNQPNGAYWVMKWYGDMEGSMVWTAEPASMIDGFSSINTNRDKAYVIFGGDGNQRVILKGFSNTSLGTRVHIYAEYTEWVGLNTQYSSPGFWFEGDYDVVNDQVTIDVNNLNEYSAHRFTITPTGSSSSGIQSGHVYKLQNVNSSKVLGISGMSTSDGAQALQWSDNGTADHEWTVTLLSNGYYKFTNVNSGKVLGISGMSTSDGALALQWSDNGTADHEWSLVNLSGNTYKLVNRNSGKVLGISGMSTSDGANALQWSDNGTTDHNWIFVFIR